jgi:hypothetical protein
MRWRVIPLLLILGGGLWTVLGQYIAPGSMGGDTTMGGMHDSRMAMTMGGFHDDMAMTMGGLTGHGATIFCWVAGGAISIIALVLLAAELRGTRGGARA